MADQRTPSEPDNATAVSTEDTEPPTIKLEIARKRGVRKSLLDWGESPFTGLGVGVIIGGIGALVSLKALFVVGGVFISIAFFRANFFASIRSGWARTGLHLLACGLLALGLIYIWRITPKPKDPPTAQENAEAVVALEKKRLGPTTQSVPAEATPAQKHVPKPRVNKASTPADKPSSQREAEPLPETPVIAQLFITQKPEVSDREEAPYKTAITVQSTVEFPALKLAIQCDGPLAEGSGGPTGMVFMESFGVVNGHPDVFVYTYGSANPPFGPANPLNFTFWSKQPIRCEKASTF